MGQPPFRFKRFLVDQTGVAHPVGTDSVLLGSWAEIDGAHHILDIGSGSGLLALMLAQRTENSRPPAHIAGVEIHDESCRCATGNFNRSPWASRLSIVHCAIQAFEVRADEKFDLIVSNPPFFTETVVSPRRLRRISRSAATLSPGDLLHAVKRLLFENGRFCAILPPAEGYRLCEWGALAGLYCTRLTRVYPRRDKAVERLLIQLERNPYPFRQSSLVIYSSGEQYTPEFLHLTGEFYLTPEA